MPLVWPDYFVVNCPPDDVSDAGGVVYRLMQKKNPHPREFETVRARAIRQGKLADLEHHDCDDCALSIYTDFEDVDRARSSPALKPLRKRYQAKFTLLPEHGKMKLDTVDPVTDSHHSWWVPDGFSPWEHFTSCTEA